MPSNKYSVPLSKIIKEMSFETVYLPQPAEDIMITTPDVNRPGLILAGYDNFFDPARINFLGIYEVEYINSRSPQRRAERLENFMSKSPAAIVYTRSIKCPDDVLVLAEKYQVPVLSTSDSTSTVSYTHLTLPTICSV